MPEVDEFGIPIKKASTQVDEFGIPVKKKDGTNTSQALPSPSPFVGTLDDLKRQLNEGALKPQRTPAPAQLQKAQQKAEFEIQQEANKPKITQMSVFSKPTFKVEYPKDQEITAKVLGFQNRMQMEQVKEEGREAEQNKLQQAADDFYNTTTGKLYFNFLQPMANSASRSIGNVGATISRSLGEDQLADRLVESFTPEKRYEGTIAGTKPTKLQGNLFNNGKMDMAKLPSKIVGGLTDMAWLLAPASSLTKVGTAAGLSQKAAQGSALFGSSYLNSREGYYQDGKAAGLKGEQLDYFASGAAVLTSSLEALFPNDIALGGFRSKMAKEYARQIASGVTAKTALKAGIKDVLMEAGIKEPTQELLQLAGDKVARTLSDMTSGSDNFGEQFDWDNSKDEIYETVVITPIISAISSGSGALRSYTPSNYEKSLFFDASNNSDKVFKSLDKQLSEGLFTPQQHKDAREKFTKYNLAADQVKKLGYSDDQTMQMAWELFSGKEKLPTTQAVVADPILKDALGQDIKKDKETTAENIRLIGMGVPTVGSEIDGKEVSLVISNIGNKGTEIDQNLVDQIGDNTYRVEDINVKELYNRDPEFKKYTDEYKKGSISPDAVMVPAVIKDNSIVDGRARLAEQFLSGKENVRVFKNISNAVNEIQEGRTEGNLVQPARTQEGQPKEGQGTGAERQGEITQANVGNSNIGGEGQVADQELSIIDRLTPKQIQVTGDATEFANQMASAQSSLGRMGMSVSPYAQEDYDQIASEGGKFLRAAGNKVLSLLKPNGEMVSLVKDASVKAKGVAQAMISRMKDMGGLFMDNYDIYLTPIYEKAGYKVVARVPFNEEYAPEGWNAEDSPLKNKPDVVFMVRNDIAPEQAQTFTDYEEAQNYTQGLVDRAVNDGIAQTPVQIDRIGAMATELSDDIGSIDKAIDEVLPNAQKSLKGTGIKFEIVDGATEIAEAKAARGNQGLFVSDNGTIIIDKSKLADEVEAGLVVWHEASHPVMNIIRNTNKPLYDAVVRGLNEAAKTNTGVDDALNWAKSQPQYDNVDTQNDEAIVETIGRINSGLIDVAKLGTGLRQKLIDFVNSIAKFFGINPIIDDTDIATFKKTVSQVADALKTGRDIGEVVGQENVMEYDAPEYQARVQDAKKDDNPAFFENVKDFANKSSFANKIKFKEAVQDLLNKHIPELRKKYGKKLDPSVYDELSFKYLSDILTKEAFNAILSHPEAIGWYDEKTQSALAAISAIHPEIATDLEARGAFILPLAVMSNGNKVDKNFELAEQQYKTYKNTGRFNPNGDFGAQQVGIKKSLKLINSLLDEGVTMSDINDFLTSKHKAGDLKYRKKDGKLGDLVSGELASEDVYGAVVLGPKIGNGFYMNLWGEFGQLTMDRWFMRTWGRLTGTLIKRDKALINSGKTRLNSALADVKADKEAMAILKSTVGSLSGKSVTDIANAIEKASAKKELRNSLSSNTKTDELRKAGNSLAKLVRGEKEAPSTGEERKFIRDVFSDIQTRLSSEYGIDITMADLQAVLWYPEKILYESFKEGESFEDASEGYTEDSAPDYFNAAKKLALKLGSTNEQINQAVSEGRRGDAGSSGGTDTRGSETASSNYQEVLKRIRVIKGGQPDLVKKSRAKAQASVGNRPEQSKDFKVAAFVMRKLGEGASKNEIAQGVASATGMPIADVNKIIADPEQYIRDSFPQLSKIAQDNLIERAKIQNIYRGHKFGMPINKAFVGTEVPQSKVVEYLNKTNKSDESFKESVKDFKSKWLDPAKGLPDWVLAIRDFSVGRKNIEIARSLKTIERLKEEAKKIGFTDWDAFSKAMVAARDVQRVIPDEDGLALFDPYRASEGKMFTTPDDMLPAVIPDELKAIPESLRTFAIQMRNQIDGLTKDLIGSGYVTPEQAVTLEKNLGQYVNRAYKMYNEKGFKPKPEQVIEATKFIADQKIKQILSELFPEGKPSTSNAVSDFKGNVIDPENINMEDLYEQAIEEAKKDVQAILDKKRNPYFNTKTDSRDTGILKERKDIPELIRKLMGEYTDPGTVFVMTVAKQAALNAQSEYLRKMRDFGMGSIFFEKDDKNRPAEFSVEIASKGTDSKSPLGGLYTTTEIAEALEMADPSYNELTNAWMKIVGAVRWGKTVGSVATQAKNFESNVGFAVLNGMFLTGENTKALGAASKYVKGQYSKAEIDQITEKVIKLNLVGQSVGARELAEMFGSGDIHDVALDIAANPNNLFGKKVKKSVNIFSAANKLYRMGDDFWKVYAYINEREMVAKGRFKSNYESLTPEQQEKIDIESSERVKNTWPTYDRVVEGAKYVSKRAPIFGNFISFQAESLRVLANSIKLAREDMKDPEMKAAGVKRMVGIMTYAALRTAITTGVASAAGMAASGILGAALGDDEEEQKKRAIKKAIPVYARTADIATIPSSEPHKFTVFSLSSLDPYGIIPNSLNALTEGREGIFSKEMQPGVPAAAAEFFSGFLEPEMTFSTMYSVMNNINPRTGRPIVLDSDTASEIAKKVGNFVIGQLEPSTISMIERGIERGWAPELASFAGARPIDVDLHKSFGYVLTDMSKQMDAIKSEYNSIKYNDKYSEQEKAEAELEAERKKAFLISKIAETYRGFIKTGANPTILNEMINERSSIKTTGFDKTTKKAIKTGEVKSENLFK